jgi:hypothetical protein
MNNKKMIIIKMVDKYNKAKTWKIKIYNCGKIMINQEVEGNRVKRDTRSSKKYLKDFIGIDIYKRSNNSNRVIDCIIDKSTGIYNILVESN